MSYFLIVMRILPFVATLVGLAEELFDGEPESGEEKKAIVMDMVKAVFELMIGSSTGGQQETWKKLRPIVSRLVDAICAVLFPHEEAK